MRTAFCFAVVGLAIAAPARAADGLLGVELIERDGRVIIVGVVPGSGAASVGIQAGDTLDKVGTTSIGSVQDALNAKAAATNNTDVPMIIGTPNGPWAINARFEAGQPYGKYTIMHARPGAGTGRPGGTPPRPGGSGRPGNPPRP
jgi:hypothetical protein